MQIMEIFEEVLRLKREGRASALATIVQCAGSSPQREGAKMLVRDDGSTIGTLGGGCLEAEAVQACLMALRDGAPLTVPFELTERHGGLVCGGKVLVYIEPVVPEPDLVILGAGHVGKALARLAGFSGFRVTVVDDREEYVNRENIPDADDLVVRDFGSVFPEVRVGPGSYIVIATRGHNHDLEALKSSLHTEAKYVGLLGSRRKKALLFKALAAEGFTREEIGRVITPVGLPIGSVTPEEIAVSIMAQMIETRRKDGISGIGDSSCSRLGEEDGQVKTAPSLGDKTVIRRSLDNIVEAGIQDIVAVVGLDSRDVTAEILGCGLKIVFNRDPESEMAESVRCGLRAVDPAATGVLVCPADHPMVRRETFEVLMLRHYDQPEKIIVPVYGGRRGHPSLFPSAAIREIFSGLHLGEVLSRSADRVVLANVDDDGVVTDLDTPADYDMALRKMEA